MKFTKILTVAITALFCLTVAGAVVASDDSSAADVTAHNIYIEVVEDSAGTVSSSFWMLVECENTVDAFIEKTNAVAKAGGVPLEVGKSGEWLTLSYDGGGSIACWYGKDGAWAPVSDTAGTYPSAEFIGLGVKTGWIGQAQYDVLTDAQKAKWQEDATYPGNFMKKMDAKITDVPETKTYHVYSKVINDDLSVEAGKWIEFSNYKTPQGFVAGANMAFKDAGMDKVSFSFSGYIGVLYDGSIINVSYFAKEGKWTFSEVTEKEYVEGDSVAFGFKNGYISTEKYNGLSDDAKKDWVESGYGDPSAYRYVFSEPTDGYKPAENNTLLFVVIGAVAVVAVLTIAFFVFKKKA